MDHKNDFFLHYETEQESFDKTSSSLLTESEEVDTEEFLNQLLRESEVETPSKPEIKVQATFSTESLEERVEKRWAQNREKFQSYIEKCKKKEPSKKGELQFFEKWGSALSLGNSHHSSFGAIYFQWDGCGVLLNPTVNILSEFHAQGLNIRHIDHLVVTKDCEECYSDILEIYELNQQINQATGQHHQIHYHLNPATFAKLSPRIKAQLKTERQSIHSLEFFQDSEDVESVDLNSTVSMHYFPTSNSAIGLQFFLSLPGKSDPITITYLSSGYSNKLSDQLLPTTLLISALGETSIKDLTHKEYNKNSLGVYGISTLIQELEPKLTLVTEFPEECSDMRLELVKRLREFSPAVMPVDSTLKVDLESRGLFCSQTKQFVPAEKATILKGSKPTSALLYLSKETLL